jgi:hypothetical protein
MSIFNPSHLVTPLLDKRNLIAILLIAGFFGIFRLADGGIEVRDVSDRGALDGNDYDRGSDRTVTPRDTDRTRNSIEDIRSVTPGREAALLEERMRRQQGQNAATKTRAVERGRVLDELTTPKQVSETESSPNKATRLADIEKSLGLR